MNNRYLRHFFRNYKDEENDKKEDVGADIQRLQFSNLSNIIKFTSDKYGDNLLIEIQQKDVDDEGESYMYYNINIDNMNQLYEVLRKMLNK
jgi:hypothetical protein